MCSSHATVRGLLHELSSDSPTVVVDTEASPEHLSRSTIEAVDLALVVAEPYFKSLETARRYAGLGRDLGIEEVVVVANKVRDVEDRGAIEEFCRAHGMELVGTIPFDDSLTKAERAGEAPLDHDPEAASVRALDDLAAKLLRDPRDAEAVRS
jgi:CO dehydrogenase maturation factor